MSTFEVNVVRINAIESIEGADAIELAVVGDYRSVVRKDQYKAGDLAVYIPEQSILPPYLLKALNLEGKLAGSAKNRVKAVKLRGCLSQGILFPIDSVEGTNRQFILSEPDESSPCGDLVYVVEGMNVAEYLGITKYQPTIPASMAGEVYNAGQKFTVAYDIENYKKYPTVLSLGEEVVMTEKLHGTFTGIGILPELDHGEQHYRGKFVVFSKGLGADGLCFKHNERNINNLYVRTLETLGVFDMIEKAVGPHLRAPLFFLGEIFGVGVQDLTYGQKTPMFRVFDVCSGYRGQQRYEDYQVMVEVCDRVGLTTVPLIYRGPFTREKMLAFTSGLDTISGANIREGVVVKPTKERHDSELGRVILKSVSEDYLMRKNKNATEFQ